MDFKLNQHYRDWWNKKCFTFRLTDGERRIGVKNICKEQKLKYTYKFSKSACFNWQQRIEVVWWTLFKWIMYNHRSQWQGYVIQPSALPFLCVTFLNDSFSMNTNLLDYKIHHWVTELFFNLPNCLPGSSFLFGGFQP